MKPSFGLACALVAAHWIPSVSALHAQAPNPSGEGQPPAAAKATKPTVVFDLPAASGEGVTLTAPRGQYFFMVLKNTAPSGSYRVTYDWSIAPETRSRPPAGALHRQYELQKPFDNEIRALNLSPACDEFQARAHDVLRTRDEREIADKLRAFDAMKNEGNCTKLPHLDRQVRSLVDRELTPVYTLYEGDALSFTVERLDPATGAAARTWRFKVQAEPVRLGWAHATEEAWIVGETSRDIAEMLLHARSRVLPEGDALGFSIAAEAGSAAFPRYTIALKPQGGAPLKLVLGFETYVWAPESYEALATSLTEGARPAKASPEGLLPETLTNPVSRTLAEESRRLSERLEQAMLDAGAHEQAALVIGTLALREAAGGFTDIRQELCRMAAHLAVARALRRGTTSPTAGTAEALLLTLVGRQSDALARIDALERAAPASPWASFLRALRIRNTRDWRILREPAKATLLERLEHYRALCQSLGGSQGLAFLESRPAEPMPDWGRIALMAGASVEEGHLFANLVDLEIDDATQVWRVLHGKPLAAERLVESLNAPVRHLLATEDGRIAPRVVGWGMWARYFQRNLCFDGQASAAFLQQMLGSEEEARQRRAALNDQLSGLELWPIVMLEWRMSELRRPSPGGATTGADSMRRELCARAVALAQNTPERLTPRAWQQTEKACYEARQDQSLPAMSRWLTTLTPAGTALIDLDRSVLLVSLKVDAQKAYAALRELAPYHPLVLQALAGQKREAPLAELAAIYGPVAEYDLRVMSSLASSAGTGDTNAYRALYEKMAAIEPEKYFDLGSYLVDLGLDDEAAAAYEKGVEKARDRVLVSNRVRWLVGHYCDRLRTERARELARMAAEVYSGGGLRTMAYLMERLGRYDEAEQWYQKVVERYGESGQALLDEFYVRYDHRVGDGRFGGRAAAAMARIFPEGLERVSIPELTAAPLPGQGVRISGRSHKTSQFGLMKDDVVVALNGYRVTNDRQYQLLWTFDDRPEATVIAWRRDRYVEVKGRLTRLAFGPASRSS